MMTMEHATPQKSWWGRNWKWLVPVGCLLPILACAAIFASIIFGVMAALKGEVYERSLELVQNDPEARQALGTPIVAGSSISGSINTSNGTGTTDITYPVSGPNGLGEVRAAGTLSGGTWTLNSAVLSVDSTGEQIDLLAPE